MKKKNYEREILVTISSISIFILEIILITLLKENKIFNYIKISTICIDKDNIVTYVSKEERNALYKNNYVYIDDKKVKYNIRKDNGVTLKSDNKEHYEIYLNLKVGKKYKINDSINIVIKDKKISMLEMFKLVWVGDEDS